MKYGENWDEYQWEREIRRHESRVARFFRGLVYCIDLPAEEASADFSAGAEPLSDPVSARQPVNPALQEWLMNHDAAEGEEENSPPERHPVCFAPVDALDGLCVQWNTLFSSRVRKELSPYAMGIICAFAKLLARVADFTESGREFSPPLLVSLGKRSLADLNEVMLMLENFSALQPSLAPEISAISSRLLIVREQLLCRLQELRSAL